jgi:hypothetical protein
VSPALQVLYMAHIAQTFWLNMPIACMYVRMFGSRSCQWIYS